MAKVHNRTGCNQGCRCEMSKKANSDYRKQRRIEKDGEVAGPKPKRLAVVKNVHTDVNTKMHTSDTPPQGPSPLAEGSVEAEDGHSWPNFRQPVRAAAKLLRR